MNTAPRLRVRRVHSETRDRKVWFGIVGALCSLALLVVVVLVLGIGAENDVGCGMCHAMDPYLDAHAESAHASVDCSKCHASAGPLAVVQDGVRVLTWLGAAGTPMSALGAGVERCTECHESIMEGVVVSGALAVRHEDFLDRPCATCHGGVGHAIESRQYERAEMDDCLVCHRVSTTALDSCDTCHVPDSDVDRSAGSTTWRVTHGPDWRQTHGMGELETCISCHVPTFCIECHGVRLPHPADWAVIHGDGMPEEAREDCATCHDASWCEGCHGIEIPHPDDFLPDHGPRSLELGRETCLRCHDQASCDICHFESSHPNIPGVGMGHGE